METFPNDVGLRLRHRHLSHKERSLSDDIIEEYKRREPPGSDTWNPLGNELELWHRVRLFISLRWALKQLPIPIAEAKILDVGCGVGRSTRLFLEFGARPRNLLGIDLRATAITYAKTLNPAIPFRAVKGFEDWPPPGRFDLCTQCTVFGSIKGMEGRRALASMMERAVGDRGFIFWWDGMRANDWAGGDPLDPRELFGHRSIVGYRRLPLRPSIAESLRPLREFRGALARIARGLGYPRTHIAALFGPRP